MKKFIFLSLPFALIATITLVFLILPGHLGKSDYSNFKLSDIKNKQLTNFVLQDKKILNDHPEYQQGVVASKPIAGQDSIALTFKNADEADKFVREVSKKFGKTAVEKDITIKVSATFDDPYYASQTNLSQMEMSAGWDYLSDSTSAEIAIVDTGIRGTHEDLTGKVSAGYNVLTSSAIGAGANSDDHGHGTSMASIAAATADNTKGIVGMAYLSSLMPVKVLNSSGNGLGSDAAIGIIWAADNGAKIINLSFGSSDYSETIHNAIQYAVNKGCIVVAAAGNEGGTLSYPARDDLTLSVGSVNSSNQRSVFSNYGSELDIMAPGEGINMASYTTNSAYTTGTGTSVSAAEISGMAALGGIWHSGETPSGIISRFRSAGLKIGGLSGGSCNDYYGCGLADYNRLQTITGDFSASFVSQTGGYPTLPAGSTATLTITYLNTGFSTWRQGVVNLGLVDSNYGVRSSYALPIGWPSSDRPAILNEQTVAPGATGSFTFTVGNSGLAPSNYRLDVGLVADGITWFSNTTHAYWDVIVPVAAPTPPAYQASFVSQTGYPTLANGSSATLTITYLNTGSATWTRGTVNLGTVYSDYRWRTDRYSLGVAWPSGDRPSLLNEQSVAPGATGSFTFTICGAGFAPWNYRLDVGLVADGITWFSNTTHAYWDVYVP